MAASTSPRNELLVRLHPLSWLAGKPQLPDGGAGAGAGVDGAGAGLGAPGVVGAPGTGCGIGAGTTTTGIATGAGPLLGLDDDVGISSRIVWHAVNANARKTTLPSRIGRLA